MSTSHPLIDDDDLSGMIDDLKKWPHTSIGYGDFELSTTLFLTFYFSYQPAHCLQTTLAMIEVKEAFEKLLGHPFTIATHPHSERPHSYGSKRLGDIREWARLIPVEKTFSAKFTDEKNHQSSPLHSAYLWRTADWRDGGEDYSSIQFYYRWQWWLENKDAWRRFMLDAIGRLKPAQVYSGFSMGNPLEFGMRAETAVWDRALAPHFYGLDTDYPFGMSLTPQLPSGIRPPTWGFFLSDIWRNKASLSSEDVIAQLADPRIRIDALSGGHWIELGPQPELYPVEDGVPALPVLLNRLLRRIRHPQLDLVGFARAARFRLRAGGTRWRKTSHAATSRPTTSRHPSPRTPRAGASSGNAISTSGRLNLNRRAAPKRASLPLAPVSGARTKWPTSGASWPNMSPCRRTKGAQ